MPKPPRILLITPARSSIEDLVGVLPQLVGIVDAVWLRWPGLPVTEVLAHAQRLVQLESRPRLHSSARFDVALAAGLDGVHLRESGLAPVVVRQHAPQLCIGASRHESTIEERVEGADYVTLSPFAPTTSKPGSDPLARARFEDACRHSSVPVLALGGVGTGNAAHARELGAYGIAVCSAIWDAADPVEAARGLRAAFVA